MHSRRITAVNLSICMGIVKHILALQNDKILINMQHDAK
jgi:hypothetical protein